MNKQFLACVLAAAMTAGALAGCSGASKSGAAAGGTAASKVSAGGAESQGGEAKTGENITLTLWHIENDAKRQEVVKRCIERFEASHPNVKVEQVPMENDPYKTKLTTAMAAGHQAARDMLAMFAHNTASQVAM